MKSVRIAALAAAACFASFYAPASASADEIVPDVLSILPNTFNALGTGCPADTTSLTQVGNTLSVSYSNFVAERGPGTRPADWTKNCLIKFGVHVPNGFTFALVDVQYGGYMQLDQGVTATHTASYFFSGFRQDQRFTSTSETGPFNGPFFRDDTIAIASTVWAPCGRDSIVNINQVVNVDGRRAARDASGMVSADATDISAEQIFNYRFEWRPCFR